MRLKPDVQPAALDQMQAAQYLGVSRSHFLTVIKPMLAPVDLSRPGSPRRVWRWLRADLDAYLAARKRVA